MIGREIRESINKIMSTNGDIVKEWNHDTIKIEMVTSTLITFSENGDSAFYSLISNRVRVIRDKKTTAKMLIDEALKATPELKSINDLDNTVCYWGYSNWKESDNG